MTTLRMRSRMGWLSLNSSRACLVGMMIPSRLHRQPLLHSHHHHTPTQYPELQLRTMGATFIEDHMRLEPSLQQVLFTHQQGPHLLHQVCTRLPRGHTHTSTQHSLTTVLHITVITHTIPLQHTWGLLSTEQIQVLHQPVPVVL